MKSSSILLVVILIIVTSYLMMRKESFTSPGTMVQLATSHVPTEEDEYYYKYIYPEVIKRDLLDMTGSY